MNTTLTLGAVFAQMLVRPWSQTNESLEARVARDFAGKQDAAVLHYAVPPMSGVQRLPDVYPHDGTAGGTVGIVMAKDEYEPGSFLLWAKDGLDAVMLEVGELKTKDGKTFPKDDLDLKVVKVWYQNRNAWYSFFGDNGFKLVPELLLNDENLIRVDETREANYARLTEADGTVKEQWINPPRQLDRAFWEYYRDGGSFAYMKPNFADADSLQPVTLKRHAFKQFFLTAHARKETPAGLYKGAIRLKQLGGSNAQAIAQIPVAVRVYDFVLPKPMCYHDDNLPFYVNFYNYESFGNIAAVNGGDFELAKRQSLATMKDHVAHGHDIHWMQGSLEGKARDTIALMKEAGCRDDVYVGFTGIPGRNHTPAERDAINRYRAKEIFKATGSDNFYIGYGDEPPPEWLAMVRPWVESAQKAGLKFILAGHYQIFRMAGYQYDWHNLNELPEKGFGPAVWNQLGDSPHIAWYAKQHVGSENPDFNRRQNGMAAYLANYSALCNYAHHFGPYNDDSEGYRPMVFTYGHYKGVIDTLQWEGFREGVDDIRYATVLVKLARKAAKQNKDIPLRYAGSQALQYLASFNRDEGGLDACRAEMVRYIVNLKKLLGE